MNTKILLWPAAALLAMSSLSAQAVPTITPPTAPTSLFEFDVNIDGVSSYVWLLGPGDPLPLNMSDAGFDYNTGLGTLTATITGAGSHNFDAFFDHDISNDPFNETGATSGTPSAGQSWEIDEPAGGDIFDNFEFSTLDNSIGVPDMEDVSMAMGFDFDLAANEMAQIVLEITEDVLPTIDDFYLMQENWVTAGVNRTLYLAGTLDIICTSQCGQGPGGPGDGTGNNGKVPEPSMLMLMSLGLAGMVASRRRKNA